MSFDSIHPFPFWKDLRRYSFPTFRSDVIAALSVALMALPQAIAYAFVANLPLSAGIFSVIFGTIFTASFGCSRYLVSGPTNSVAILIQSVTSEILYTYYRGVSGSEREMLALQIVLQIVLIVGVFQIVGGLVKLGRLTQFTSRSVVTGYMTGAAFAIIITQLYPFFGLQGLEGYHPLYQKGWFFLEHFFLIHIPTAAIGIASLILLIFFYRFSQKIPGALIVFALTGIVVALFQLSPPKKEVAKEEKGIKKVALLGDLGPFYSAKPRLSFPHFDMRIISQIIPLAFAITLLTSLEVTAIGRNYTSSKDPPYSDNQEMFGLGISNFLSSFLGAMPSSGSFSRTTLNHAVGAKTRFAAIFSGILGFLFLWLIGPVLARIPITSLSALMLFTAYSMINFKQITLCLKAPRPDAVVVIATFASTLFFTLDVALYIGIILSVVLYLKRAAIPYLIEYTFNNFGKLRPMEVDDERLDPRICIFQVEGELFFGAADLLQTKLRQISEDENLKVIILQLMNARNVDASICLAIRHTYRYLKNTKRIFMISGITPEVEHVFKKIGLIEEMGKSCFFKSNEQLPSEPTRMAYAQAKQILSFS